MLRYSDLNGKIDKIQKEFDDLIQKQLDLNSVVEEFPTRGQYHDILTNRVKVMNTEIKLNKLKQKLYSKEYKPDECYWVPDTLEGVIRARQRRSGKSVAALYEHIQYDIAHQYDYVPIEDKSFNEGFTGKII